MPRFWSSPQTIDAFRLSIVSVVFTAAAGIGGCVAFGVSYGCSAVHLINTTHLSLSNPILFLSLYDRPNSVDGELAHSVLWPRESGRFPFVPCGDVEILSPPQGPRQRSTPHEEGEASQRCHLLHPRSAWSGRADRSVGGFRPPGNQGQSPDHFHRLDRVRHCIWMHDHRQNAHGQKVAIGFIEKRRGLLLDRNYSQRFTLYQHTHHYGTEPGMVARSLCGVYLRDRKSNLRSLVNIPSLCRPRNSGVQSIMVAHVPGRWHGRDYRSRP